MLQTDIRHDLVRSFYRPLIGVTAAEIEGVYQELEAEGGEILRAEHIDPQAMTFRRTVDMRYVGQEYFVNIPLAGTIDQAVYAASPGQFHAAYQTRYGHSNPEEMVEFVNLRVSAVGHLAHQAAPVQRATTSRPFQTRTRCQVVFGRQAIETAVYQRDELKPGDPFYGPAIIEEASCTTVIPQNFRPR